MCYKATNYPPVWETRWSTTWGPAAAPPRPCSHSRSPASAPPPPSQPRAPRSGQCALSWSLKWAVMLIYVFVILKVGKLARQSIFAGRKSMKWFKRPKYLRGFQYTKSFLWICKSLKWYFSFVIIILGQCGSGLSLSLNPILRPIILLRHQSTHTKKMI